MKFGILKHFVKLGWAVLLSDVDIAVLQVRAIMLLLPCMRVLLLLLRCLPTTALAATQWLRVGARLPGLSARLVRTPRSSPPYAPRSCARRTHLSTCIATRTWRACLTGGTRPPRTAP